MRLTLRTLLAYMDETLAPEDARAIAEKLTDNEFAQGLTQRIQSSVKRLRLGAPRLDGKGMGSDPNTVAEFLNDTLPPERMSEFEKVCLESDVHLAEVAACHQIITLALSEPADVPAAVRDRMYALPKLPMEAHEERRQAAAASAVPIATLAAADEIERVEPRVVERRPEIPEYLRAARRGSWRPLLATAALLLLLFTIAMLAMGSLDENHPVLGVFFEQPEVAQRDGANEASQDDRAATQSDELDSPQTKGSAAGAGATAKGGKGEESSANQSGEAATDSADEEDRPTAPALLETDREADADDLTEPATSAESDPAEANLEEPASDETLASSGSAPAAGEEGGDPAATTSGETSSGDAPASSPDTPADAAAADAAVEEGGESPGIGRFIASDRDHVLGTFDAASGSWFRLPTRAVLQSGQRLLVLPSYRPQLALSSGIHCVLIGPTFLELGSNGSIPTMRFAWGQVLMDTAGIAGSEVSIGLTGLEGRLTFASADSAVAVSVEPWVPRGEDPATVPAADLCRIFVTTGEITWTVGSEAPQTVKAGQLMQFVAGAEPEILDAEPPSWIDTRLVREIDLRASRELAGLLEQERPLSLSLSEQVGHRQIEVSALAMESLGLLEEFVPMVTALSNERHHAYWRTYFSALQAGIQRGSASADAVKKALTQVRPEYADAMYRLLYGYSEEQLDDGAAKELVESLESPVMEIRVLALENLRRITNRTHLYRPEREPIQQRKALQDWGTTLSKGLISYERPSSGRDTNPPRGD